MLVKAVGSAVGVGGALTAMIFNRDQVRASWTSNYQPTVPWDHNWDFRDPCSCVKPTKTTSATDQNKVNEHIEGSKVKATRHLILVRHGQYVDKVWEDEDRKLTKLGREQAELTGIRLKQLCLPFSKIVYSTMTRATETAQIIARHVTGVPMEKCDLVREGAPFPPEPKVHGWQPEERTFFVEGARIEAGFRKYFHRADPKQEKDSYELLVCHGNVIRYFVCRGLQLPPEAWLRFSLYNASITWVTISPRGNVSVKCIGDVGFMPPDKMSTG